MAKQLLVGFWFVIVGLLATVHELRACGWAAQGLEYRPYEIYCSWAVSCGGSQMCESGSCWDGDYCIGWWQHCIYGPFCGLVSECQHTVICT